MVFSISLGAQKTKKGKQKPDPKPTKETTKVSPTDKKEKEDTLISVKTDTVQPVEEKSEKKEKEESSTQAKDEAKLLRHECVNDRRSQFIYCRYLR